MLLRQFEVVSIIPNIVTVVSFSKELSLINKVDKLLIATIRIATDLRTSLFTCSLSLGNRLKNLLAERVTHVLTRSINE